MCIVDPTVLSGQLHREDNLYVSERHDAVCNREVKWYCKYARQNGIHVSPTFMIDGLVQADMSSGDPVVDWVSRLLKQ